MFKSQSVSQFHATMWGLLVNDLTLHFREYFRKLLNGFKVEIRMLCSNNKRSKMLCICRPRVNSYDNKYNNNILMKENIKK